MHAVALAETWNVFAPGLHTNTGPVTIPATPVIDPQSLIVPRLLPLWLKTRRVPAGRVPRPGAVKVFVEREVTNTAAVLEATPCAQV